MAPADVRAFAEPKPLFPAGCSADNRSGLRDAYAPPAQMNLGYLWLYHPRRLEDSHSSTIQSGRYEKEKDSKSLPSSPTGT